MPRLRVDNVGDQSGATNPISVTIGGTVTWVSAPANMPTVASPNTLTVVTNPNSSSEQRVIITACTAGATSATASTTLEGGGTLAAVTSQPWVHGPTTADFSDETVLFTLANRNVLYHQLKAHMVGSGTFTAKSSTVIVEVDVRANCLGNAYTYFSLVTGVNGGAAGTPLYNPNTEGGFSAAGGVTEFNQDYIIGLGTEGLAHGHGKVVLNGLTIGRVYTWQLVSAAAGGSQTIATVGRNPYYGALMPDNSTLWVSNYTDNAIQPISLGQRPFWSYGLAPVWATAEPPSTVGTNPFYPCVSPNGQYVMVPNFTSGTVTAVNAQTHQIIGTVTVNAAKNVTAGCFTQDSTVCWVACTDGKVYPLTFSLTAAPTVGTGVLVDVANDTLFGVQVHPDGKTLYVADNTANRIYAAQLTSNTTLGAWSFTAGAASGQPTFFATPFCYAAVAAGTTLTSATFNLAATINNSYANNFPPQGGTIYVPTGTWPYTWVSLTYDHAITSGSTITFYGCTGGGAQTTVAANIVMDPGVWMCMNVTSSIIHIPGAGAAVDKTITVGTGLVANDIAVTADGAELWAIDAANPSAVHAWQTSDGSSIFAPVNMSGTGNAVNIDTNGQVLLNVAAAQTIFEYFSAQVTLDPNPGGAYSNITVGRCVVTGKGVA